MKLLPVLFILALAASSARAGRIAVLRDDFPELGAPSSPERLAAWLRDAGHEVEFVDGTQVGDAEALNAGRFDLLVLPYGPVFPAEAAQNLFKFLKEGGSFFSTGGYAFDAPVRKRDGGWITEEDLNRNLQWTILGDFEAQADWRQSNAKLCTIDRTLAHGGGASAKVSSLLGAAGQPEWTLTIPDLKPGDVYELRGFVKTRNVSGQHFAYLAVYQYDSHGNVLTYNDMLLLYGTTEWTEGRRRFRVRKEASQVLVRCGIYQASGDAWFDDITIRLVGETEINTRHGEPHDALTVEPQQIGAFDPSYTLQRAVSASAARGQFVVPNEYRLETPLEGYAASGVIGTDAARWVPIVNGYDRFGRLRGAVGAILHHYGGYYTRSSWGYFGVANRDLFDSDPTMLLNVVDVLLRKTYLHKLKTNYFSYRTGEPIEISVKLSNFGERDFTGEVRFEIEESWSARMGQWKPPAAPCSAKVGETVEIKTTFEAPPGLCPLYRLTATLVSDEKPIDQMVTGFAVLRDEAIASGPKVDYQGNYLRLDGRPAFLTGSDTYCFIFTTPDDNPLVWDRDLAAMRDHCIDVNEILEVTPTQEPPYMSEEYWRGFDAHTMLTQMHGMVYFAGLLIGFNTSCSDVELQAQSKYLEAFAKRYRDVPGMIYYLNGDLSLRIENTPDLKRRWNEYLKSRYADDEILAAAWKYSPPTAKIGEIALEDRGAEHWDDLRAVDVLTFKSRVPTEWLSHHASTLDRTDPKSLVTAEFYQRPSQGIDVRLGAESLTMGNIGYFDQPFLDIQRFPSVFKLTDLRAYGKSLQVGEFGAKTHPAWSANAFGYHIARAEEEQHKLYLAILHYAFGLGGSKVHNWCWKDNSHYIFPWGLIHANDGVPKDVLSVYRAASILLHRFQPKYETPEVVLLMPDAHRLGPYGDRVYEIALQACDNLVSLRVDFNVWNEETLPGLLRRTKPKAIVYPIPYCVPPTVARSLREYVENGGALYVSGDLDYGPDRRRTGNLLRELCGLLVDKAHLPDPSRPGIPPAPKVKPAGDKEVSGLPGAYIHRLGKGLTVYYRTPDEALTTSQVAAENPPVYARFLQLAGVKPVAAKPEDPNLHVFRVPTTDGGRVYVFFSAGEREAPSRTVRIGRYTLVVGGREPGLLGLDAKGGALAVEGRGEFRVYGKTVVDSDCRYILISLDDKPVWESKSLMLLPTQPGKVKIARPGGWKEPTVEVGEVVDGRWRAYETLNQRGSRALTVPIDADRATAMILISERSNIDKARSAAVQATRG